MEVGPLGSKSPLSCHSEGLYGRTSRPESGMKRYLRGYVFVSMVFEWFYATGMRISRCFTRSFFVVQRGPEHGHRGDVVVN